MGIDRAGNDNPCDAAGGAGHEMVIRIRTLRRAEVWLKRQGERREWTAVEDAESGDLTRFQLWDKADWNGSKKHRRCFCGSSSAGSLLSRKLQRLSLQDRTPAAVVSSSSAMAQHRGEGIVEVAHRVEEAASQCSRTSASKKQTISSQKTVRRARSFRPRHSKKVILRGWQGERRDWTAEEVNGSDENLPYIVDRRKFKQVYRRRKDGRSKEDLQDEGKD